jgi:hypothetical protein
MHSDRLVRSCLVAITLLLATIALRPIVFPTEVRGQNQHEYKLVVVSDGKVPNVLAKETKEGWEPIGLSFFREPNDTTIGGYLLFRKQMP